MDNYIKTIINGLKAWVTSGLNRLEASVTKLSGNLDTLGSKITSLTSKVTKNAKDIAELQEYENETYGIATEAKSAAGTAQTTANEANNAAVTAQTTANNAQSTANIAQTTANNAQSAANTAKNNAAVKWADTMLGFGYDVSIINENIAVDLSYSQLPTGVGDSTIYMLIASFRSGATKVSGITGVKMQTNYVSFGESVTIDAFDVIKIYRNAGETQWRAAKTGINLGANALVTALSEVYEE